MSLFSIYRVRLRKKVYLTFGILMGSFLVGRSISFFLDNSFGTGTALIFANELNLLKDQFQIQLEELEKKRLERLDRPQRNLTFLISKHLQN